MQKNIIALLAGAVGAALAYAIHLPLWILGGPALAVSLVGLAGVKVDISGPLRQGAFLLMGLGVGTGVTPQAVAFMVKTPPAFILLIVMLLTILMVCKRMLVWLGYDRTTATLASAPGHLSFVLALAEDKGVKTAEVSIIQMIRILVLMFTLPLIVVAMGFPIGRQITNASVIMPVLHMVPLVIAGLCVGYLFQRWRFPAALVLAGMCVSAVAQLAGLTEGALPDAVMLVAFGMIGCLIGTRFSGVSLPMVARLFATGVMTTAATIACAIVFAWVTALILGVPITHTLIAMAPGGLETMITMGAVLGVNPSFVAAMHVWRLIVLTFLIPWFVHKSEANS